MKTELIWHKTSEELPEEGLEVLAADIVDEDSDDGQRYCLLDSMFYFHEGTILKVETDRSFEISYPGKRPDTSEERLFKAIFGTDDDLQEIEQTGWYTRDSINEKHLMRFRLIKEAPEYWCVPVMPDGIRMNWKADFYKGDERSE